MFGHVFLFAVDRRWIFTEKTPQEAKGSRKQTEGLKCLLNKPINPHKTK